MSSAESVSQFWIEVVGLRGCGIRGILLYGFINFNYSQIRL